MWTLLKLIIILLAISAFTGCGSSKDGKTSKPVTVKGIFKKEVPGDSASLKVSRSELLEMEVGESREAKSTKTTARITKTSNQNFKVDCNTAPDTVEVAAEVTCPPVNIIQPDPVVVEVTPWWNYVLIIGLLAMCAYLSFRLWLAGKTIEVKLPDMHGKL